MKERKNEQRKREGKRRRKVVVLVRVVRVAFVGERARDVSSATRQENRRLKIAWAGHSERSGLLFSKFEREVEHLSRSFSERVSLTNNVSLCHANESRLKSRVSRAAEG